MIYGKEVMNNIKREKNSRYSLTTSVYILSIQNYLTFTLTNNNHNNLMESRTYSKTMGFNNT